MGDLTDRKALLLDRDGVIIEMVSDLEHGTIDSARRPESVKLLSNVGQLIRNMNDRRIPVAVVSNQPGVAKGTTTPAQVEEVNARMRQLLRDHTGAEIDLILCCFHHAEGTIAPWNQACNCRKPRSGLLASALHTFGVNPSNALMVGDGFTDVAAGKEVGCSTALVASLKPEILVKLIDQNCWPDILVSQVGHIEKEWNSYRSIGKVRAVPDSTKQFLQDVSTIAARISLEQIEAAVQELCAVRNRGGRVFVAGNGGGASNASHFAADLRKLAGMEAYCVSDNVGELSARANDDGWDSAHAAWLKASRLNRADHLFVFSVGGGNPAYGLSTNLVGAMRVAQSAGVSIGGIVGPKGGFAAEVGTCVVQIPAERVETLTMQTEGFQGVVSHLIIAHPKLQTSTPEWEKRLGEGPDDECA